MIFAGGFAAVTAHEIVALSVSLTMLGDTEIDTLGRTARQKYQVRNKKDTEKLSIGNQAHGLFGARMEVAFK